MNIFFFFLLCRWWPARSKWKY